MKWIEFPTVIDPINEHGHYEKTARYFLCYDEDEYGEDPLCSITKKRNKFFSFLPHKESNKEFNCLSTCKSYCIKEILKEKKRMLKEIKESIKKIKSCYDEE